MQAVRLREPGRFEWVQVEEPRDLRAGEVLVRVRKIGICGTDLHAYLGHQPFFSYPRILGHELGVEVERIGAGVSGLNPGDRCAVEPYLDCGECIACRRGRPNCCEKLAVLGVHVDGGMRSHLLLPARKLHVSATLSFEQLALVETVSIGAHAVNRAAIARGEKALVIGAGPIGLGTVQMARAAGAEVVVLDIDEARLRFCSEQQGVERFVMAGEGAVDQVREACGGELPTVVFDATGNPCSMQAAFDYVAHGGSLVFVGLFQGDVTFHDPDFHRRELTLYASRNATAGDFTRLIAAMETGEIDVRPWITHRAELGQVFDRFDEWTRRDSGVIKALVG